MANKTYTVAKDGTELKELKTLAAAKKLADAEDAEVFFDGECVYRGSVGAETDPVPSTVKEKAPEKYTLLRKMNVRKAPSLNADKLGVLDNGAVVEVTEIKDDWLFLTDGSFILYENGKNAKKN